LGGALFLERRPDGGVAVGPAARARDVAAVANLLTPPAPTSFDAILCRNLLHTTPGAGARA
jgi:chemotaxis methyl-accepting protein methylase